MSQKIFAQLPETVVYLFDVQKSPKLYSILNPKIISKTKGYNNQPYFTPDGNGIYFVSSMDTSNTEIYFYSFKRKKAKRITRTPEPEYSPKYTADMSAISCVRVEKDKKTQHFYTYTLKGKKPLLISPELVTIGYYDWINQTEYVSFELDEPFSLVKHNYVSKRKDTLANAIGRTFYFLRNKSTLVYVDKSDSMNWKIRMLDKDFLRKPTPQHVENYPVLTETLPKEEDYCFMQDGSILMGHEGKIYIKKNPFKNKNATWNPLFDLTKLGIQKFYRIAMSMDNTKLAVVVYKGDKP